MKEHIHIGVVQQCNSPDIASNRQKLREAIGRCALEGAELVVLQELHNTLYFCKEENPDNFDLAETVPGPSTEYYGALAKKHHVVLVLSLFEKRMSGVYHNTAVVLETDGSIAGTYRKMHIPDDPGYYEKYYFTPGDTGFQPVSTTIGRLGVLVCWDQWFPESARLMALHGAELLIYPTAIGWEPSDAQEEKDRQFDAWVTIQRSHAIANGLPVVVANRVGFEQGPSEQDAGIAFWGNSFVAGPQGELLKVASATEEEAFVAQVSLSRTEDVRRAWPFLRDRRIDHYQNLLKLGMD
jgi:N-carbamoylputrescine amidase